ncbi:MAG: ATP synthase subunit I, partial [Actinobacteria bacterium]|nr:ATP synthase subunit I [Actinomycetota bacterium]
FGLAIFQVFLVLSTVLPVWKKLRQGDLDGVATDGSVETTDGPSAADQATAE